MSSAAAGQSQGGPSTTTSNAAAAATGSTASSSNAPPQPPVSPSYTFSAEAAPFIPSFMRVAPLPAPQSTTAAADDNEGREDEEEEEEEGEVVASGEGSEENYRQHFSKKWMLCLEQMQGQEVGMLMEMMPLDIQDLYFDKLSDEYLHHDHEHKDKGVHALCAAQKMVVELSPEQLVHIEEFLVETDALNPEAKRRRGSAHIPLHGDGDQGDYGEEEDEELFMNDDDSMGLEEEEWLLEQMMVAAGHGDEVAATKKRK